jgi:hypothetical protein
MGHNVYAHIKAVQDGNDRYDNNIVPDMLLHKLKTRDAFRQLVDAIFSANSRGAALALVDNESNWYKMMIGSSANGRLGKKTLNAFTKADEHFHIDATPPEKVKVSKSKPLPIINSLLFDGDDVEDEPQRDDSGLDESLLDKLEIESEL